MYALYHQRDPPTVIDHTAYCSLIPGPDKQLIAVGGNRLRVFRLNPYILSKDEEGEWEQTTKLECLLDINLVLPVASLSTCAYPGSSGSRDCILLAFQEAKLSICAYDASTNDLITVSLHSLENELMREGFTRNFQPPIVRGDPEGRCVVMMAYGRYLCIVPMTSSKDVYDENCEVDGAKNSTPKLFSYVTKLTQMDNRLVNITDMCFLNGYYEPTLLLLYEPAQTNAGRIALRADTYAILAVSLNIKDKVHAVVWTAETLPYDSFRCTPVPKPMGGVMITAANSLIYLNQSVPAYGVAVNSCVQGSTQFPLEDQQELEISLRSSDISFITNNSAVVTSRGGIIYVVSLLADNTNVMRGMNVEKCGDGVLPETVCALQDGFIFIGSRLGSSQLLKYIERDSFSVRVATTQKKPEDMAHLHDDLAIYGELTTVGSVEHVRVVQYHFKVSDWLLNIAPCRSMAIGLPASLPDPLTERSDPVFDVVMAGGHEKEGCLVIQHRALRPTILTSSQIAGALNIWTVGKVDANDAEQYGFLQGSHQYLLVSKEVLTMVLELRQEITELESSGFVMDQRTIGAGELGQGRFIIQVTPMLVVLLQGTRRIQQIPLDISFPVAQISISDPYVLLITENGELLLVELIADKLELRIPHIQHVPATSACIYKDISGFFSLSSGLSTRVKVKSDLYKPVAVPDGLAPEPKLDEDMGESTEKPADPSLDEDLLLYGEDMAKKESDLADSEFNRRDPNPKDIFWEGSLARSGAPNPNQIIPSYWAVITRENGLLEIFSLPNFDLVYMVKKFPLGMNTLFDTDPFELSMEAERAPDEHYPLVQEISVQGFGANQARPHLVAIAGDELLVFEIYQYDDAYEGHLRIRMKRVPITAHLRNVRQLRGKKGREGNLVCEETQLEYLHNLLYPFEGVGGYSGIFIAGFYPYWLIMTPQGSLRCHPMNLDGAVRSFAQFHNVNCPDGFLYLLQNNFQMRICRLPETTNFDAPMPTTKIDLKMTVTHVVYQLETQTYVVSLSWKEETKKIATCVGDEKQFETLDKGDNAKHYIYPTIERFKVQLYSPETWSPVPESGEIVLEEYEHITCLKEVMLKSEAIASGLQSYIAMGTISNYGEEVLVRGRIFIVEVIEVVPDPDQPMAKYKLKTLYCKDQKVGPVTSVCSLNGYFLTGMASKVYIWQLKDGDLLGISFLDIQFYVHDMISIRNLAVISDVYKSISLLRYQEEKKALSLAARDYRPTALQAIPYCIDFLIDNKQLAFMVADEDNNVTIFQYNPEDKQSLGGSRLTVRADINVGEKIVCSQRVQLNICDPVVENKQLSKYRHLNIVCTQNGSTGYILPLSERVFRRLQTLQQALYTYIPQYAGLNPKAAKLAKGPHTTSVGAFAGGSTFNHPSRYFLDGDLIFKYLSLSLSEKHDLGKRIGSSKEQVLDDLLEIQRTTTHF